MRLTANRFVPTLLALSLAACGGDSGGAAQVIAPNVLGDTQAAAITAITGAGLTVGTLTEQSSGTVDSGEVISQSPAVGTSVAQGSSVALVISGGAAQIVVPYVVDDTLALATNAITFAGLTVGAVTEQSSSTVALGQIISESPVAGITVAPNWSVALVISSGIAQVSVPNVVSDTQAAATGAITDAGLAVGAVTEQSSSTLSAGQVISENPAAGTIVAQGSSVALVISSGAAQFSVPNVVGDTQAAATAAITGAGLTLGTVTQQSSTTVVAGQVISENPAAGTTVAQSSSVALVISIGNAQSFSVGGTVIGLRAGATVHVLNGTDNLAISANGAFTFPTAVASGGKYKVTVGKPTSAQTCAVQNASGTITSADVTNIAVYCTYNVSTATLHHVFTGVGADCNTPLGGSFDVVDENDAATFDGMGNVSVSAKVSVDGLDIANVESSGTYGVTTTNAIPTLTIVLTNSAGGIGGGIGGIEGVNGDANLVVGTISGTPSAIVVSVLPNANATTDSLNGNYTLVDLSADPRDRNIYGYVATIALTNGTLTGSYTENLAGTITTGNPLSGQWTVTAGIITAVGSGSGPVNAVGSGSGAVSADGDLIVLADTARFENPHINVAVPLGTGVTEASFEGVYSVVEYTGSVVAATTGSQITLFAYGNGTYSEIATENNNGTITANKTDTGTYTVAANGTLALTGSKGDVHNGAISPDGNALVLGNITSGQEPAILVGVRQ